MRRLESFLIGTNREHASAIVATAAAIAIAIESSLSTVLPLEALSAVALGALIALPALGALSAFGAIAAIETFWTFAALGSLRPLCAFGALWTFSALWALSALGALRAFGSLDVDVYFHRARVRASAWPVDARLFSRFALELAILRIFVLHFWYRLGTYLMKRDAAQNRSRRIEDQQLRSVVIRCTNVDFDAY
ncbi:MAG TPA: hypothetical protein VFF60_02305 [Candidatus Binatus sp.]|nr:hypothetical protein [Candidatus Binatus sp.]